jgi:hypothetical protein
MVTPKSMRCLFLLGLGHMATAGFGVHAAEATYDDIAPILSARCVMCHAGPTAPAGLQLDSYAGITKGSRNGPVAVAGNPAGSELLRRLKGERQPRMPMTGPPFLSEPEIKLFERWVAGGLKAGRASAAVPAPKPARPAAGEPVSYAHVAPIFATRCAKCHADNGQMGSPPEGYRLTSHAATLASADRARVVPGQPQASELWRRIRGQALPRMPFDGPPYLSDDEMLLIEQWIKQGASNSAGERASLPVGAGLRLHGQLTQFWVLDGLLLTMNDGARVKKAPRPGDYVEVRGRVGADGSVIVERIRPR